MAFCVKCGVELEEGIIDCPLCNEPIIQDESTRSNKESTHENPGYSPLTRREKVRLFWELSSIFHFSALVVVFLIDLIASKRLTWSLYAITCIIGSYVYISLISMAFKKLWIFLPGLLINSLGIMILIDLLDNGIHWFFNPGLPLAGFFVILLGLIMFFGFQTRQKGFNIVGLAALAVGIYCILIEIFIKLANHSSVNLSWSVIVGASILPFSLFLFFFHYRLKRGTSLRRFFHL